MYRHTSGKLTLGKVLRVLKFVLLVPITRLVTTGPRATFYWAFDRFRLFITGNPTLPLSRITPQLYIGGQIRQSGWRRLQADGVTAVVNMRREHDDRAAGLDIPSENYLHIPTVDDTPVTQDDLLRGADWIAQQVAHGGAVYVHCAAGSGRAPSMGAAYLIKHQGMTTDQALATIIEKRPFIMPLPDQVQALRQFEAAVHGHCA